MNAPKTFEDPDVYEASIRRLVPAYDTVAELAAAALSRSCPSRGTLGVVGCGPGPELVRVAAALPGWHVVALEPSVEFAAAARREVARHGLADRVDVFGCTLEEAGQQRWDAACSLFVAHLIPDDGARAAYWESLAAAVVRGGTLVHAEIEAMDRCELEVWVTWAHQQGLSPERLEVLRHRLGREFCTVPRRRTTTLVRQAGFEVEERLLGALGVTLARMGRC